MRLSRRRHVAVDVPDGFHAAEAPALQRTFRTALDGRERGDGRPVPATLDVTRGLEGRVVLTWRNLVVGFVPPERAATFADALPDDGRTVLTVPGVVHRVDGLWRVWVGDVPADGFPPVPDGLDTLAPPEQTIGGIALRRPDRH